MKNYGTIFHVLIHTTFIVAFRCRLRYAKQTIIQAIQPLSLFLSFQLAIQSQISNYLTYSFSNMLHSLLSFPHR